ncbi:minor capsid protein [Nocardiopsis tropica]|uniref:Minor capsid protein n=1 Tax=Nocardiopsis tropica TaxID=109330 RepID=A0ABU7KLX7_9ACTN|nr:minor capsid protein [Nocardiopsis umidischolae]MEE2050306.1 minor capsid protein [Nocardiopsis umidischolae]
MTLTEELCLLLHELGVGTYDPTGPGGTIYGTTLPDAPDTALAVALYGTGADASAAEPVDAVRIQLRARGTREDSRTGERLAQAAYDALNGLGYRRLTPGGTWLQLAYAHGGSPGYIGRDQNARHEWTANLTLELERPTAARPGY